MTMTGSDDMRGEGVGWFADQVDVLPQDAENQRIILEKIQAEKITDEVAIRALVDACEFTSPEAKQHTTRQLMSLLNMGALNPNKPAVKGVKIEAVETDAPRLIIGRNLNESRRMIQMLVSRGFLR